MQYKKLNTLYSDYKELLKYMLIKKHIKEYQ